MFRFPDFLTPAATTVTTSVEPAARPVLVSTVASSPALAAQSTTVASLVAAGTPVVALVKPQFEVGREHLSRAGIVRDPAVRAKALDKAKDAAVECGFGVVDALESPIQGGDGNHEFLLRLERT